MKLSELAEHIGAEPLDGSNVEVRNLASLQDAGPDEVSFLSESRYAREVGATKAAAVIVPTDFDDSVDVTLLRVADVDDALETMLHLFAPATDPAAAGIHETAAVATTAKIDPSASVGSNVSIGANAVVGAKSVISAGCVIGHHVIIGDGCLLGPNVAIYHSCRLGNNVIIHANTTIGADGFGYRLVEGRHRKIPHIGVVVIEDDVEIGANSCIDRAKFGETRVGRGTKVDNLVQIAHNVRIGENCIVVSQVGLSGSVRLGNYVVLGGQCGVADHVTVGDGTMAGAQCGIPSDLGPGLKVVGSPATEFGRFFRELAVAKKLPELARELKQLKKQINKSADAKNNSSTG